MKTKAYTFVFILSCFKGISSVEKSHRISSSLALGVCSHAESGDDSDPTVSKPETEIGNGSFKRSECNDTDCNMFSFSQIKGRTAAAPNKVKDYREQEIGPQSQFTFERTKIFATGNTMYVHVTFPELAWPFAMYACASNGMVLTSIDNSSHKFQIQSLLLKSFTESQRADVWIGGSRYTDDDKLKKWNWFASGQEVGSFLWAPGKTQEEGKFFSIDNCYQFMFAKSQFYAENQQNLQCAGPPANPKEWCVTLSNTDGKGTFYSYEHNCKDRLSFLCKTLI